MTRWYERIFLENSLKSAKNRHFERKIIKNSLVIVEERNNI